MKERYIRAMDAIHTGCLFVAGAFLVVIVLIIPYGVFTRYVLNSAASWPEPLATLLMIVVSFLSAVVCYREYLHIGVGVLPAFLHEPAKSYLGMILEVLMLATNLFMLVWGIKLVPGDLAPGHPGIPRRYRRPFLSADPDRRRAHRPVRHRALHDAEVLLRAGARDGQPAHHRIAEDGTCVVDILILVGGFTIVCLMGMPVAYALGIAAIAAALYAGIPLEAVMLKVAGGMSGFSLLAIPFFILTGAIMAVGGMAERLVNLAKVFVGFIRGGMALVNILASTMFGCISGSSVADTAAVGSVMIPQMIKNGYPRLFAVNVTISGSLQPLLVPPSHNMIIYSIAAGGTISVAHLFMGGIIPALLLGLSLIILVLIIAYRNKFPRGEIVPLRQAVKIAVDAIWGMVTVVIILGGILSGVFTPTESGAVACIYAFLVTMFVYRDVKWREVPKLIARVVRTVGMVMIMIGFSIAFGYMMAIMRIPAKVTEFFVAISSDKYTFLLYVNVLLLLLGTFMDLAPMLLICTPIFLPVIKTFGIDPVHFGIIMILNLGIGLLTPPVGPTMVVGCAIGRVSMEAVSRSILIFYVPMLIVLALVTYVPALSLWLPSLLLK